MPGIDARNKQILDPKFICPICTLILRDPVQLSTCGHRQCQSCFDTHHG
jgi:TNF receptor-associated factor 4